MRLLLIGIFWVGGAVLGWDTAAATHSTRSHAVAESRVERVMAMSLPHSSTLVVVRVPAMPPLLTGQRHRRYSHHHQRGTVRQTHRHNPFHSGRNGGVTPGTVRRRRRVPT